MKRQKHVAAAFALAAGVAGLAAGCGDDDVMSPEELAKMRGNAGATAAASGSAPQPLAGGSAAPVSRRGGAAAAAASAAAQLPPRTFNEADFTASDANRDPFRSYVSLFARDQSKKNDRIQQKVIAERYALDELKLVAIVSGGTPRAMFVDPERKGWIVTLGQLIGRSETVKGTGAAAAEYDLNWRVDRIRDGDVVFVRENPGRANIPTATRVIALRSEGDSVGRRLPP